MCIEAFQKIPDLIQRNLHEEYVPYMYICCT